MVEHYVILMSEMVANFQLDASLLQAMTKKRGKRGGFAWGENLYRDVRKRRAIKEYTNYSSKRKVSPRKR